MRCALSLLQAVHNTEYFLRRAGLLCLSYKEHAWVTVARCTSPVTDKPKFLFSQQFFSEAFFLGNSWESIVPPFPNTSPTLFELVGGGNHKLSGSNKGSGDPFVENDRQTGTFSGNHQPRARQVRGREVSHRKELDTRVSLDSHTKEYFLGLSVDLAFSVVQICKTGLESPAMG